MLSIDISSVNSSWFRYQGDTTSLSHHVQMQFEANHALTQMRPPQPLNHQPYKLTTSPSESDSHDTSVGDAHSQTIHYQFNAGGIFDIPSSDDEDTNSNSNNLSEISSGNEQEPATPIFNVTIHHEPEISNAINADSNSSVPLTLIASNVALPLDDDWTEIAPRYNLPDSPEERILSSRNQGVGNGTIVVISLVDLYFLFKMYYFIAWNIINDTQQYVLFWYYWWHCCTQQGISYSSIERIKRS